MNSFNFPLKEVKGGGKVTDELRLAKYSKEDRKLAEDLRMRYQEQNKRRAALRTQKLAEMDSVEMKAEEKRKESKRNSANRNLVAAASMKRQRIAMKEAKSLLPDASEEEVRSCPPFLVFFSLYLPSPFLVFFLLYLPPPAILLLLLLLLLLILLLQAVCVKVGTHGDHDGL